MKQQIIIDEAAEVPTEQELAPFVEPLINAEEKPTDHAVTVMNRRLRRQMRFTKARQFTTKGYNKGAKMKGKRK